MTTPYSKETMKINTHTNNFTIIHLPTINAMPIGIMVDKASGLIWIAEGIGNLASIDPTRNYKITVYPVTTTNGSSSTNSTHYSPTELFMSTLAGNDAIYISDHDN